MSFRGNSVMNKLREIVASVYIGERQRLNFNKIAVKVFADESYDDYTKHVDNPMSRVEYEKKHQTNTIDTDTKEPEKKKNTLDEISKKITDDIVKSVK